MMSNFPNSGNKHRLYTILRFLDDMEALERQLSTPEGTGVYSESFPVSKAARRYHRSRIIAEVSEHMTAEVVAETVALTFCRHTTGHPREDT